MVVPEEDCTRPALLFSCPSLSILSQGTGKSNKRANEKPDTFRQDVKQLIGKVSERKANSFTHSLHRVQRFSCDSPVQFMLYSEASAALIGLHLNRTVSLYKANGHKETFSGHFSFLGLTATVIPGCLVGWGPGPVFTLLDSDLHPLDVAEDALDICVCEAAEHSSHLVTAGFENVCVWSVMLMKCKMKIQEGLLQHSTFTHMALAPSRPGRPHRAFVACGHVLTVVDLDGGKVLEHKKDLSTSEITAMAYSSKLDCLIIASQELSMRVWGPDWEPRGAFLGHTDMVNSLFLCSELNMMISSSADSTIRCWNVEECKAVHCVNTEQLNPPLYIGGSKTGDTLFSFSHQGVDLWTIRTLYTFHCQLRGDKGAPVRQILVSHLPAPYPKRVFYITGDNNITLVAAQTGTVLTCFKAEDKIVCADYCMQKEILLALTEAGTVLKASTLTNPITLIQEWKGIGQEPWQHTDHMTKKEAQNLPVPGPACCLVLYSCVVETQRALDEWRDLQDMKGCSHSKDRGLDDANNEFLIIIGQSGGCVSVLRMNNGKVLYRMPAHDHQKVTTMQVYPEYKYLLTTGEDMTVVVWRIYPFIKECLIQQMILQIDKPQVYLAVLGHQLALAFQESDSNSYSLKCFNLLKRDQAADQPREGHSDQFTGLCVIPELKIFISSSLDKTVRIWNEENQLIGTLHLQAVPQCVAYSGFGGVLFLGIGGDLCRIKLGNFLPHNYRKKLHSTYHAESSPDVPIPESKETYNQINTYEDEQEMLATITSNQLLHRLHDMQLQQQNSLITLNMDLDALLQGTVKCTKGKPPGTEQTKKEAFRRYMNIMHDFPLNKKVNLKDTFHVRKFSFHAKTNYTKAFTPPRMKEKIPPQRIQDIPVKVEKKKLQKQKAPVTLKKVITQPVEKVIARKPVIVEKVAQVKTVAVAHVKTVAPQEILKPKEKRKLKRSTQPRPRLSTSKPLPLREPSPEVPTFLKQFAEMEWFIVLYPDGKSVPSNLTPDDFLLYLLNYLQTCSAPFKIQILAAMRALHSQGLFQNTDKFYISLLDSLHKFARPDMSHVERTVLGEMLNLLVRLKSELTYDFMKKLLTLVAYKELDLRKTVLDLLGLLGMDEAEQWLGPELESWDSELQDLSNTWESLHCRADHWLELWTSKFKIHNRYLYIRSSIQDTPPTFSVMDVLNYFCSVRREEHRKARFVVPAGHKNTALLPLHDCYKPILRLGETYSMTRIRKPAGVILPPRQKRPSLTHFPNFITLPLPRVTPRPFHIYTDEDRLKVSTPRYFIHQQSWVEYYR